jgi:hypothetical protein
MATETERRQKLEALTLEQLQGAIVAVEGMGSRPTPKERPRIIARLLGAAAVSETSGLKLDRRLGLETEANRKQKKQDELLALQERMARASEQSAAASESSAGAALFSSKSARRSATATVVAAICAAVSVIVSLIALIVSIRSS